MRAIVVTDWVDPSELKVSDAPEPEVWPGTVRINIKAAGCNFFDNLLVQGRYQLKPPLPFIPGSEFAGVVSAVGEDVDAPRVGDRVFACLTLGGYAEQAVIAANAAYPIPESMSFEQAAASAVAYPTSYAALVYRAGLQPGETVLVTAAAGGVGLAAVQLAKALGARVIAAAGGPEKIAVAQESGADVGVDYLQDDWIDQVKKATGYEGVDVVIECVGGDIFDGATRCIAWNGRIVTVGFASGRIPEVRVNRILLKNISVVGLHWGQYHLHEPEKIVDAIERMNALFEAGKLQPKVWKSYPLEELPLALEALASRRTTGKVVITL